MNYKKSFKKITASIIALTMILSMFLVNCTLTVAAEDLAPADIVSLLSPDYRSDLNGPTELKVIAPGGYTKAYAYYTDAPNEENSHPLGHTVTVGPADLDKDGIGIISFDSNDMPNGPVMVMVEAFKEDGVTSCTGYFQFFNLVGEEWNAGLTGRDESIEGYYDPEIALPDFINENQKALGKAPMKTVFADDMEYENNNDIKAHISRNGIGKTYGGHYPNHKDDRAGFFGPEKAEESGMNQDHNPYRAVKGNSESYLLMIDRVHSQPTGAADWGGLTKYVTSPCLSSIDEEGHSASLPEYPEWDGWSNGYTEQYFETRVYFGPNPGTWPAFWTLSNGPWKNPKTDVFYSDDNGGKSGWRGTDELDIVEAWHTARVYSINTHAWSYLPVGRNNEVYGGGVKGFDTMKMMEEAGTDALVGDFHMGFHTVGCYITEETTYYFFNGELIGSHATIPMTWRDGNRFLLNTGLDSTKHQAFPEGYGFTRYGNANYTYVDWIRVWEAPVDPDVPVFDVEYDATEVQQVMPGEELELGLYRINDAAKDATVTYKFDLPEGWKIVGNDTFKPLRGKNYEDIITFSIPEDYIGMREVIDIKAIVDGKEYGDMYIVTENNDTSFKIESISPYYVAEKDRFNISVKITNDNTAIRTSEGGTVTLVAPDGTEKVSTFPPLNPGESHVLAPFEDINLDEKATETYKIKLKRDDGLERIVEKKFSGLAVFKTEDFDFGSEGTDFDASQWEGGMVIELDPALYTGASSLKDEDDLSVTMYTKWSDKYLYIAAITKDEDHVVTNTADWGGLWDGDSIQISFDPTREMGYANDLGIEHIRLTGGINVNNVGGFGVETFLENGRKAEDIKTNFFRSNSDGMTYYMMAIPWDALLKDGVPVVDDEGVAESLGFSLLVNDRDGADSRGWLKYMDGIGSGKMPQLFGDLTLTNATEYVDVPYVPTATEAPTATAAPEATEAPADGTVSFEDVLESDWFYGDVNYAVEKGLFNGTSETTFSPEAAMTRAMFVTVLHRMDGAEAVDTENPFVDVADDEYYAEAVKWASTNKIVNGVSADSFAPDAPVSRQDIAVMLQRYMQYKELDLPVTLDLKIFADEDQISEYAKDAIQTMNKLGIITGKGNDVIDPLASATRAEVAAMLHRFLLLE